MHTLRPSPTTPPERKGNNSDRQRETCQSNFSSQRFRRNPTCSCMCFLIHARCCPDLKCIRECEQHASWWSIR